MLWGYIRGWTVCCGGTSEGGLCVVGVHQRVDCAEQLRSSAKHFVIVWLHRLCMNTYTPQLAHP